MSIDIDINTIAPLTLSHSHLRRRSTPLPVPSGKVFFPVRLFWRIRQFVRGLLAHVDADEMLVVARTVPKAALCRFCEMPLDGQRHSLNVLYTLLAAGWDDPDLAAAALLHDVGKVAGNAAGISLSPWLRGPLVLLNAMAPARLARLASDNPATGWRFLLHVHREHPAIGAAWATVDGCSELICWLIEHHQDKSHHRPADTREELLALLQWADRKN